MASGDGIPDFTPLINYINDIDPSYDEPHTPPFANHFSDPETEFADFDWTNFDKVESERLAVLRESSTFRTTAGQTSLSDTTKSNNGMHGITDEDFDNMFNEFVEPGQVVTSVTLDNLHVNTTSANEASTAQTRPPHCIIDETQVGVQESIDIPFTSESDETNTLFGNTHTFMQDTMTETQNPSSMIDKDAACGPVLGTEYQTHFTVNPQVLEIQAHSIAETVEDENDDLEFNLNKAFEEEAAPHVNQQARQIPVVSKEPETDNLETDMNKAFEEEAAALANQQVEHTNGTVEVEEHDEPKLELLKDLEEEAARDATTRVNTVDGITYNGSIRKMCHEIALKTKTAKGAINHAATNYVIHKGLDVTTFSRKKRATPENHPIAVDLTLDEDEPVIIQTKPPGITNMRHAMPANQFNNHPVNVDQVAGPLDFNGSRGAYRSTSVLANTIDLTSDVDRYRNNAGNVQSFICNNLNAGIDVQGVNGSIQNIGFNAQVTSPQNNYKNGVNNQDHYNNACINGQGNTQGNNYNTSVDTNANNLNAGINGQYISPYNNLNTGVKTQQHRSEVGSTGQVYGQGKNYNTPANANGTNVNAGFNREVNPHGYIHNTVVNVQGNLQIDNYNTQVNAQGNADNPVNGAQRHFVGVGNPILDVQFVKTSFHTYNGQEGVPNLITDPQQTNLTNNTPAVLTDDVQSSPPAQPAPTPKKRRAPRRKDTKATKTVPAVQPGATTAGTTFFDQNSAAAEANSILDRTQQFVAAEIAKAKRNAELMTGADSFAANKVVKKARTASNSTYIPPTSPYVTPPYTYLPLADHHNAIVVGDGHKSVGEVTPPGKGASTDIKQDVQTSQYPDIDTNGIPVEQGVMDMGGQNGGAQTQMEMEHIQQHTQHFQDNKNNVAHTADIGHYSIEKTYNQQQPAAPTANMGRYSPQQTYDQQQPAYHGIIGQQALPTTFPPSNTLSPTETKREMADNQPTNPHVPAPYASAMMAPNPNTAPPTLAPAPIKKKPATTVASTRRRASATSSAPKKHMRTLSPAAQISPVLAPAVQQPVQPTAPPAAHFMPTRETILTHLMIHAREAYALGTLPDFTEAGHLALFSEKLAQNPAFRAKAVDFVRRKLFVHAQQGEIGALREQVKELKEMVGGYERRLEMEVKGVKQEIQNLQGLMAGKIWGLEKHLGI